MWEFIDKVIYINLDHRTDRLENIKKFIEIGKFPPEKVIRFSAIKEVVGAVGCSKSHIEIIKMAIKNNFGNILILEDDCKWVSEIDLCYNDIKNLVLSNTDVVLLGGGYNYLIHTNQAMFSFCTSSYLVKKHYFPRILLNFEAGLLKLVGNPELKIIPGDEQRIKNNHDDELDTFWSILMRMDNWRVVLPKCVTQILSYSDVINDIRYWQIIEEEEEKNRFTHNNS